MVRAVAGGSIIGCMATVAGVGCSRVVAVVACVTVAGDGCVCAGDRPNGVVVEGRRRPRILAVAGRAGSRELRSGVVRIGRSCIICRVAAVAGIRRVVVIAVVADCTVIGNRGVRTLQHIIVVVYRECGRIPVRIGGVAGSTIGRQT